MNVTEVHCTVYLQPGTCFIGCVSHVQFTFLIHDISHNNIDQCCSQGQNSKAMDDANARTLKAEAKAWTLEACTLETKTKARTLESKANFKAKNMTHNFMPIYHTPLTWRLHQSVSHSCLLIRDLNYIFISFLWSKYKLWIWLSFEILSQAYIFSAWF